MPTRAVPRVALIHHELPDFFVKLQEDTILQQNVRKALSHLLVAGKRRHHLIFDETAVAGGYDIVYGLCPDESRTGLIVGGGWSDAGENDWSKLAPEKHDLSKLPEDKKSKLYLDIVMTRNDSNRFAFHL